MLEAYITVILAETSQSFGSESGLANFRVHDHRLSHGAQAVDVHGRERLRLGSSMGLVSKGGCRGGEGAPALLSPGRS